MSFLDSIMNNKLVQKQIFGQVSEAVKENGIKWVVIEVTDTGEFKPVLYKENIVVLTLEQYNKLIEALKSNL